MAAKSSDRTHGRRRLLRLFAVLLSIPLVPLLLWWTANRFDEAPSGDARRYGGLAPRSIADADNAWMHFAGIGAAEDDDPVRLARRRVDAMNARHAHSPLPAPDTAEQALFIDPLPMVRPDVAIDGTASLCPAERVDCIQWAGHYRMALARLEDANRVRLQRYRSTLALRDWQGMYPPSPQAPMPDVTVADLHRNLLALQLGGELAIGDVAAQAALLRELADAADFWRQVASQGGDLFSIVVASAQVHRSQLLAGDALDRMRPPIDPQVDAQFDRLLAPLPADIDWERALSFEYRGFEHTMRDALPGTLGVLRGCFTGELREGCFKQLAMDAAYVPQATYNLHAANTAALQRWLEAPARDIEDARARYGEAFEAMTPNFDGAGAILSQMSYNYAGRILAAIAVPKADYGLRLHDREAARRMLVVRRQAVQQGTSASDMPAFLATQPEVLRDPYSGEPFGWDALFRQMQFSAKSGKPGDRAFQLPYRGRRPAGVALCADPFEIELVDLREVDGSPALRYVACGDGSAPAWADAGRDDDPRDAADQRMHAFEAWRMGDDIGLRLLWNDGRQITRHEARLGVAEGDARAALTAVDGDEAAFSVRVRPGSTEPVLAIEVEGAQPRALAQQLAGASGVRVRGIERLGVGPLTLRQSLRLGEALGLAADAGGRTLRQVSPTEYVIE